MFSKFVLAQNLVPDPGFELRIDTNVCIGAIDTAVNPLSTTYYRVPKYLKYWHSPTYVLSLFVHEDCETIRNYYYGDIAPIEGQSYASFSTYGYSSHPLHPKEEIKNARSYLQTRLSKPLKKNFYYKVSFYVSPTYRVRSDFEFFYATSNIGAYISEIRPTVFTNPNKFSNTFINKIPQIKNDTNRMLNDTSKWYEICGLFKAKGGEQWLTIGNFLPDSLSNYQILHLPNDSGIVIKSAFYFLDMVSVKEVNLMDTAMVSGDTIVCPGSIFSKSLRARPGAGHYLWSTGDTTESIVVDSVGTYWLNADYGCGLESDTFKIKEYPQLNLQLGSDIVECADGDSIEIKATAGFSSYLWSTGDTTNNIKVKKSGLYSLRAISVCDTLYDSVMVTIHPIPPAPLVNDTGFCVGDSISFSHLGQNLKWYEDKNDISALPYPPAMRALGVGGYTYYVSQTINGCESEKSRFILSVDQPPFLNLSADTILCGGSEYSISVPDNGWNYHWNNDKNTSSIVVDKSSTYILTAANYCGIAKDTIKVNFQAVPAPPYVENSKFCNTGVLIKDSLKVQGVDLRWYSSMDDSTASLFPDFPNPIVEDTIHLFVSQTINTCESEKTGFYIEIIEEVELNWPKDTTLCEGGILILGDSAKAEYLWNTNEYTPFIEVIEPGLYSVSAKNYCGTTENSIQVYFEQCSTLVDIPNIFTPNNDGIYDYFGPFGKNFHLLEIAVFNKWGNKIYSSDMHWDGRFQGNQVPEGQYYYIIRILDKNNELVIKKGIISLVR